MKIDKKIKEIFLHSNTNSHKSIEDLLKVFQISIEEVILSVDKSDSQLAKYWLEGYVHEQNPESPTITEKTFNHLFSLCEYKKMDVNYLKYFDYIDILDKDNIEKMQALVEKENRLHYPFFTRLFNKKQNHKLIKEEFIFKIIDLLNQNNKNLYRALYEALMRRESIQKQYLNKGLSLLDLSQSYVLLRSNYNAPLFDAFKECCIKNNTTWSKFIADLIKKGKNNTNYLSNQYWRAIIKRESAKELQPIFEVLNKKKIHEAWGMSKTVVYMYEKKVIEEEKAHLLQSIAPTDKKSAVLKV